MWKHLQAIYSQVDQSRKLKLEYEIANINQEDRGIHSLYVEILKLWTKQDMISSSNISGVTYSEFKKGRDHARVMHFLMKLRPEFENVQATLINRGALNKESID